jgi:hypothetical protein
MANGSPTSTFDKAMEAVKQLGMPIVVSGVLLWFMITKFDAALIRIDGALDAVQNLLNENRAAQVEVRENQTQMRSNQTRVLKRFEDWMAQGCRPEGVGPPPGVHRDPD